MTDTNQSPRDDRHSAVSEAEKRIATTERAAALRKKLAKNQGMGPIDQEQVAEATWRLLDRCEQQHRISKATVLHKAGIGSVGDSTKHLSQYAIDPSKPQKTGKRLNKRPAKYVAILNTVAEMVGTDPDDALLEVFGATSLNAPGYVQEADLEYEELARLLRDIAEAISVKRKMQPYFSDVMLSGVCLSVAAEYWTSGQREWENIPLKFGEGLTKLDWPIMFREASNDSELHDHNHGDFVPAYPAAILGEWFIGEPSLLHYKCVENPGSGDPSGSSFSGTIDSCRHTVELRLCIVPVGPDMRPEAALRVKISLWVPEVIVEAADGISYKLKFGLDGHLPTEIPIKVNPKVIGSDRSIACQVWCKSHNVTNLVDSYSPPNRANQRSSCWFLPMTGTVAQDWFSLPTNESQFSWTPDWWPVRIQALGPPLFFQTEAVEFSRFKTGTIAAALEHNLCGLGSSLDNNAPLLDVLDSCAKRFVSAFNDSSADARAQREAALTALRDRLRQMRGEDRLSPSNQGSE